MASEQKGKMLEAELAHGDAIVGHPDGRDLAQRLRGQQRRRRGLWARMLLLGRRRRFGDGFRRGEIAIEEWIDYKIFFKVTCLGWM